MTCYHYVPACLAELQQADDPEFALHEPTPEVSIDTVVTCSDPCNTQLASVQTMYWRILIKQIHTFLVLSRFFYHNRALTIFIWVANVHVNCNKINFFLFVLYLLNATIIVACAGNRESCFERAGKNSFGLKPLMR